MTMSTRSMSAAGKLSTLTLPLASAGATRVPSSSTSVRFRPMPRRFRYEPPAVVLMALPPRCAVGVAKNCGSSSSCSAIVEPGLSSLSSVIDITVTGVGAAMPVVWRTLEPVTMISSSACGAALVCLGLGDRGQCRRSLWRIAQ